MSALRQMVSVELENVTKRFGSRAAVDRLNVSIDAGALFVLLGPSGSGKTTALRLIAGLLRPDEGQIRFNGEVVNDVEPHRRPVAMVFQQPALLPHLDVVGNVGFGLKLGGVRARYRAARIKRAAELARIEPLLQRRVYELSGGERQRVALACALATEPAVLLLDEPLSDLDAPLRTQLREEFSRLHAELGTTVIYVTHDQAEALMLGDRVALLVEGRLRQMGLPEQLFHRPADIVVARFLGDPAMSLWPGRFVHSAGVLQLRLGRALLGLPEHAGRLVGPFVDMDLMIGYRPEDVLVAGQDGSRAGGQLVRTNGRGWAEGRRCSWPLLVAAVATVNALRFRGADCILNCTLQSEPLVALVSGRQNVSPGQRICIQIDLERLHLFDPHTGRRLGLL